MNFMQNTNKLIGLIENDHLGHWSPEKDCLWLTFRQPVRKPSSAQVVETSVANKSPSQDPSLADDHFHVCYSWVQTIFLFKLVSIPYQIDTELILIREQQFIINS